VLTLNEPDKRNALSTRLTDALADALMALESDVSCRAVVITGGRHFCSGGSLDGLNTSGLAMRADMRRGHRIVRSIMTGRLPVVAAVEGAAFGAGLALAAACDHVVADPKAKFGAVWGKVGIMPDWGALQTLPLRMGVPRARRLMLFSEVLDATAAVASGLADELAAEGQALETALARATVLADTAPGALSAIKTGLVRFPQALEQLLEWEADTQALLIASPDFAEGRNAFFEKRAARFTGT
jgi:enoyl-CoA hydratase/carnithine racemase